ncbi:MAG TPA: response regulator, partial [Vicinamibacterales bacterium]|nr:response regulator [Vicinamibacterales bacterium]
NAGYVLLADDNADMRDYARRMLSERWTVDVVTNGREALEAARAHPPDVIVTDVMMPELDGLGLLKALRADRDLEAVPVIMLSARAGEEARCEGLAASADDFLVKPFSARDLMIRVDALMLKSRTRAVDRRHSKRMASLFRRAPVAIAVWAGPDHVYELANEKYRELIGGRDVVGQPVRDAVPELHGEAIHELLESVRRTEMPYVGKAQHVTLSRGCGGASEDAHIDFVYEPLVGEDGSVDTIVFVGHDVSALVRARQEAEAANRHKDEFLATLSHELRTPLNAVLGYTQMLRGGAIRPDRLSAVLETIERNAQLQEHLVRDVLDVSRIITGKLRLDVGPVDLARVIQDALETVALAAAAKGVRLQPMLEHPGAPVAGDARRLQQVVWNLLSNAVKFTPRRGRVQIRLQQVNSHVEISVSDTGEGIPAEFLPRLFQRFQQSDGTITRAHNGLGLGLAISRHLVEAHGGRIEATSSGTGLGTTVRVQLPLMIVHPAGERAPNREHPTAGAAISQEIGLADLRGIRVLLVDDDADAPQMAKDALTFAGATVVNVSSAPDAMAALDRDAFDVAVLDVEMPEVDGCSLLVQIRQRPNERQGQIPAVVLTAYTRTAERTRSLNAGFQMYLSKPVQPSELSAAVLALAGGPRISSNRQSR